MRFSYSELAECAEREGKIRVRVYANRIETGRMTNAQAQREIAMMQAIAAHFRDLAARSEQLPFAGRAAE